MTRGRNENSASPAQSSAPGHTAPKHEEESEPTPGSGCATNYLSGTSQNQAQAGGAQGGGTTKPKVGAWSRRGTRETPQNRMKDGLRLITVCECGPPLQTNVPHGCNTSATGRSGRRTHRHSLYFLCSFSVNLKRNKHKWPHSRRRTVAG